MSLSNFLDGREPHYLRLRNADLTTKTPASRPYLPPAERAAARRAHINACELALGLPLTIWPDTAEDELEDGGDE
jgi:hypothetical protein